MRQARLARGTPGQIRGGCARRPLRMALLSAGSDDALLARVRAYRASSLADSAAYSQKIEATRQHDREDRYRVAFVFDSDDELRRQLEAFVRGDSRRGVTYGHVLPARERRVAFVFTGHGGQRWDMGGDLFDSEPVFREVIERCDALLRRTAGWSLIEQLYADERRSQLSRPELRVGQVALFALQAGLAALWQAYGVEPVATIGHSVGEVAAAYVAGALDLDTAMTLVRVRGELMQRVADVAPGRGAMAAVQLGLAEAEGYVCGRENMLSLAAHNGPRWVTFSGDVGAIDELAQELEQRHVVCRTLPVSVAAHTSQVDGIRAELESRLAQMRTVRPRISMYSTVTGGLFTAAPGARHWGGNLRDRVLFAEAMGAALADGIRTIVEVGPHPALGPAIRECMVAAGVPGSAVASLARDRADHRAMLSSLAALYVQGQPIHWKE